MALPGFRCTAIYELDGYAITETYVWGIDVATALILTNFKNLIKARLALSGFPLRFWAGRISPIANPNRTIPIPKADLTPSNPGFITYRNASGVQVDNAADTAKDCITLLFSNATGQKKLLYLAGIPDVLRGEDPSGPRVTDNPWWNVLYLAYRNELLRTGWGWIGKNVDPMTNVAYPIIGTIFDPAKMQVGVVTGAVGAGFNPAVQVQVKGVKRTNKAYKPVNGVFSIASKVTDSPQPGNTTIWLANSSTIPVSAQVDGTGTIRLLQYSFYGNSDVSIDGQTTRKRGNRVLVGPGKRSIKKYITA